MIMGTGVNNEIVKTGVLGIKMGHFGASWGRCNSQNKLHNSQNRGFGNIGKGAKC